MHLPNSIPLIALLFASTQAITVSYDPGYDVATRSLDDVACSNGANGLITRFGYLTQGQIPTFPKIGGASTIAGWNSPNCGQCYSLTYVPTGVTIFILAVDSAGAGFNIAESAMNTLTNGLAVEFGRIDANWALVTPDKCGLPAT